MLTIWWCPYVELSLVLLEEGVFYEQCILLQYLLAFSLFCTPRPNLPVTPGIAWLLFCIPVPYDEEDIFFGC